MENQVSERLKNIVHFLGGKKTLGRTVRKESDLQELILQGIPKDAVFKLQTFLAISDENMAEELDVTPRTIRRWRDELVVVYRGTKRANVKKKKALRVKAANLENGLEISRLKRSESDRVIRLSRILAMATEVLEDKDRAAKWLDKPNVALGNQTPFDKIRTESGSREVEELLVRLEYGGVA